MADGEGNTLHDNAMGWIFILLGVAAVIWFLWYQNAAEIRNVIRWFRYGEMWIISHFIPNDYTVMFQGKTVNWQEGFAMVSKWDAEELKRPHLGLAAVLAMQPLRMIFVVLLGLGALWSMFSGPRTQYRRDLGLQGLIEHQADNFPVITPFVEFNPSKQPPRPPGSPVPAELPSFAEALGPEEWLAYNSIPVPDGVIDRAAAGKAFKKQLIGRWQGVKGLEPYQQILLAAFCLKASRKRDESDDLLGRIAVCWSHEKGLRLSKDKNLLKDARKVLKTKDLAQKTLAAANRHAYVTTALTRALQYAREEGGVLAPAQFVWLRGHDRTLWYPLNNLGRQSLHMEAVGAMSHFKSERLTQRPIPVAKVDRAVDSIVGYMGEIKARPIPVLDYKGSKKKAIKKAV